MKTSSDLASATGGGESDSSQPPNGKPKAAVFLQRQASAKKKPSLHRLADPDFDRAVEHRTIDRHGVELPRFAQGSTVAGNSSNSALDHSRPA